MSITLSLSPYSFTVGPPRWGYTVDCVMGIHVDRLANGNYHCWDDGNGYDSRVCRCQFILTEQNSGFLFEYFRDPALARGQTVTLGLGSLSGWFPFGPDKGDSGNFTVRLLSVKPGGMQTSPMRRFLVDVTMVMVTAPAYSLPTPRVEGGFQVGTVAGLRFPEAGFSPSEDLSINYGVTRSGAPVSVDMSTLADFWTTEWRQVANQDNAACLTSYITGTCRGADCTIVAPAHYWPFGIYQAGWIGAGTYAARLIVGDASKTVLTLTHARFDAWEIPLRFWMRAKTA